MNVLECVCNRSNGDGSSSSNNVLKIPARYVGFQARSHRLSYCWTVQTVLVPLNTHSVEHMCKRLLVLLPRRLRPLMPFPSISPADIIILLRCCCAPLKRPFYFHSRSAVSSKCLKSKRFHYSMRMRLPNEAMVNMMIVHEGCQSNRRKNE